MRRFASSGSARHTAASVIMLMDTTADNQVLGSVGPGRAQRRVGIRLGHHAVSRFGGPAGRACRRHREGFPSTDSGFGRAGR